MHTHTQTHSYVCILHIYTFMHIHTYACAYVDINTHTFIHIHTEYKLERGKKKHRMSDRCWLLNLFEWTIPILRMRLNKSSVNHTSLVLIFKSINKHCLHISAHRHACLYIHKSICMYAETQIHSFTCSCTLKLWSIISG